jgi:hypothetical protein
MEGEDIYNLPISIEDAASMLRRNISKNEKPYVAEALKFNNRLVDEWKKTVLVELADKDGKIRSGKVAGYWITFEEGRTIQKYMELKKEGLLPDYDMKTVEYWKTFFQDLSISEIKSYGYGIVSRGWAYLTSYLQEYYVIRKWEKLYSQSDDPLYWEKNSSEISGLSKGGEHPFWDEETVKDIHQKVSSILSQPIKPS